MESVIDLLAARQDGKRTSAPLVPLPSKPAVASLVLLLFALPIALWAALAHGPISTSSSLVPPDVAFARNALVVVAHPDDEALFFSPSLSVLRSRGARTHLLVISSGDHYGLGWRRRQELQGSCSELGIAPEHCVVLDEDDLRDAPRKWWPTRRVEDIAQAYVDAWGIDLVITFDDAGLSGHLNHRATFAGVASLATSNTTFPATYSLKTVHFKRFGGYSLFEIVPAVMPFLGRWLVGVESNQALLVSTWANYRQGVRAFKCHGSQGGWSSWLWRSRYMYANSLRRIQGTPPAVMRQSLARSRGIRSAMVKTSARETHVPL